MCRCHLVFVFRLPTHFPYHSSHRDPTVIFAGIRPSELRLGHRAGPMAQQLGTPRCTARGGKDRWSWSRSTGKTPRAQEVDIPSNTRSPTKCFLIELSLLVDYCRFPAYIPVLTSWPEAPVKVVWQSPTDTDVAGHHHCHHLTAGTAEAHGESVLISISADRFKKATWMRCSTSHWSMMSMPGSACGESPRKYEEIWYVDLCSTSLLATWMGNCFFSMKHVNELYIGPGTQWSISVPSWF